MNTYLVYSVEDFNKYYALLKSSASIGSVPERFFVGFDIEYISKCNSPESFKKLKYPITDIAICCIQISSSDVCLVIHVPSLFEENIETLPNSLINIIKSDSWIKLGVGIDNDLRLLSESFNLKHCGGGIELSNLCILGGIKNPNLISSYNRFFGTSLTKISHGDDWSQPLSPQNIEYAAKDAYYSYKLGFELLQPSINNIIQVNSKDELHDPIIHVVNSQVLSSPTQSSPIKFINYIGKLNEYILKKKELSYIKYIEIGSDKSGFKFGCQCELTKDQTTLISTGFANNKKDAKHDSAKNMLDKLNKF
jgi:hypothetical protein